MKRKLLDPYRNINIRELIGIGIKVLKHPDLTLIGSTGKVIDETRNMFLVRMEDKDRKIAKKGALFEFTVTGPGGTKVILLEGDDLVHRPEDRTKKLERKRVPAENVKRT
jgi:ribonuclease P protein subunit POP4